VVRSSVVKTVESLGESLGEYLREQRVEAELSLRQLADRAGVSNPYLSQIERGLRRPSADVLQQIAKGLRISAEQLYLRAGILDPDQDAGGSVELAVLSDARLTERQKASLLDVYASFLALNASQRPSPVSEDAVPDEDAVPNAAVPEEDAHPDRQTPENQPKE
jgi:transcriptional regulator with XRE-family HTH domain